MYQVEILSIPRLIIFTSASDPEGWFVPEPTLKDVLAAMNPTDHAKAQIMLDDEDAPISSITSLSIGPSRIDATPSLIRILPLLVNLKELHLNHRGVGDSGSQIFKQLPMTENLATSTLTHLSVSVVINFTTIEGNLVLLSDPGHALNGLGEMMKQHVRGKFQNLKMLKIAVRSEKCIVASELETNWHLLIAERDAEEWQKISATLFQAPASHCFPSLESFSLLFMVSRTGSYEAGSAAACIEYVRREIFDTYFQKIAVTSRLSVNLEARMEEVSKLPVKYEPECISKVREEDTQEQWYPDDSDEEMDDKCSQDGGMDYASDDSDESLLLS